MIEKTTDFDAEVVRYRYTPQVSVFDQPEFPPELEALIAEQVRAVQDKLFMQMLFYGVAVRKGAEFVPYSQIHRSQP